MGWFNKIRNILFEEEEEEIPTYPKKSEEKISKREIKQDVKPDVKRDVNISNEESSIEDNVSGLDSIMAEESVKRRSVQRDIDLSDDILDDVPGSANSMPRVREEYTPAPTPMPRERKPIFQNFDEEEFDRLNNRPLVDFKKDRPVNDEFAVKEARKANGNFSSTSTGNKNDYRDPSRYKLDSNSSRKPFSPSPVISPVYGILDKNYHKDDIVDKTDGIKREIIKPINRQEISSTVKDNKKVEVEITIDSIRQKAYGEVDDLEKGIISNDYRDSDNIDLPYVKDEPIEEFVDNSIEESIEKNIDRSDDDLNLNDIISPEKYDEVDSHVDEDFDKEEPKVKSRRKIMDEVEKTSTLQILDDIEKELNSIKPEKEKKVESDEEEYNNDATLENDLFNLIDSMYTDEEKGDGEDD